MHGNLTVINIFNFVWCYSRETRKRLTTDEPNLKKIKKLGNNREKLKINKFKNFR